MAGKTIWRAVGRETTLGFTGASVHGGDGRVLGAHFKTTVHIFSGMLRQSAFGVLLAPAVKATASIRNYRPARRSRRQCRHIRSKNISRQLLSARRFRHPAYPRSQAVDNNVVSPSSHQLSRRQTWTAAALIEWPRKDQSRSSGGDVNEMDPRVSAFHSSRPPRSARSNCIAAGMSRTHCRPSPWKSNAGDQQTKTPRRQALAAAWADLAGAPSSVVSPRSRERLRHRLKFQTWRQRNAVHGRRASPSQLRGKGRDHWPCASRVLRWTCQVRAFEGKDTITPRQAFDGTASPRSWRRVVMVSPWCGVSSNLDVSTKARRLWDNILLMTAGGRGASGFQRQGEDILALGNQ